MIAHRGPFCLLDPAEEGFQPGMQRPTGVVRGSRRGSRCRFAISAQRLKWTALRGGHEVSCGRRTVRGVKSALFVAASRDIQGASNVGSTVLEPVRWYSTSSRISQILCAMARTPLAGSGTSRSVVCPAVGRVGRDRRHQVWLARCRRRICWGMRVPRRPLASLWTSAGDPFPASAPTISCMSECACLPKRPGRSSD